MAKQLTKLVNSGSVVSGSAMDSTIVEDFPAVAGFAFGMQPPPTRPGLSLTHASPPRLSQDLELAMNVLEALKEQKMTLVVLQKTSVGRVVNQLRKKLGTGKVVELCRELVASWKTLVPAPKAGSAPKAGPVQKAPDSSAGGSAKGSPAVSRQASSEGKPARRLSATQAPCPPFQGCGDNKRDAFRKLLSRTLGAHVADDGEKFWTVGN